MGHFDIADVQGNWSQFPHEDVCMSLQHGIVPQMKIMPVLSTQGFEYIHSTSNLKGMIGKDGDWC